MNTSNASQALFGKQFGFDAPRTHFPEGDTFRVPQQPNFSDCGVFLIEYAERFAKEVRAKEAAFDSRSAASSAAHFQSDLCQAMNDSVSAHCPANASGAAGDHRFLESVALHVQRVVVRTG